jgi:hypothetical protein
MTIYRVGSFLRTGEIYITPEIQSREHHPFTMQRAKKLFDWFREETFELNGVVHSLFIYEGKEALPEHSFAKGLLYSQKIDELMEYARQSGGDLPDHVGTILLEYGAARENPCVRVQPTEAAARSLQDQRVEEEPGGIRELRSSIDSQGKITWYCRYCEEPIGEDTLSKWDCPVCHKPNNEPIDWVPCWNCEFSPAYFVCPHCLREFDIKLFNFNVHSVGATKQRLAQLVISCGEGLSRIVEGLSTVTKNKLGEIEFELPIAIRTVYLNSYHIDQKLDRKSEWFHFSLFASEDSECATAYLSVVIPTGDTNQDRATIEYLHLNSIPTRSSDTPLISEAGIKRTLDPKIQRIIRSLNVRDE